MQGPIGFSAVSDYLLEKLFMERELLQKEGKKSRSTYVMKLKV